MRWTEFEDQDRSWDDSVNSSKDGTFFHTTKWIGILEKSFNSKIKCYQLKDGTDQVGLVPFVLSAKYGFPILLPIPISDFTNVIIKDRRTNVDDLFWSLKRLSKDCRSMLSLFSLPKDIKCSPKVNGLYEYEATGHMILDLEKNPPDRVWNNIFNSKVGQRNDINKLERNGFEIKPIENNEDLSVFYKYYTQNMEFIGATPLGYDHFETIYANCSDDEVKGWTLTDGHQIAGGLISFLHRPSRTMYLKYLSLNRDLLRTYTPTYTLYWNAVNVAYGLGCETVCFGSTSHNPKLGHYKMKERMGCQYEPKKTCFIPRNILVGESLRIYKSATSGALEKHVKKVFKRS
jgi:Acetyltransferase (GNAT) domain